MRRRSSSSTGSAPTNRCGGRSSTISASARRAVAFDYPGYGDSDPAPEGTTRDDYAVGDPRRRWTSSGSTARTSAACRSAESSRSRCTTPTPKRCASLILADTFAVHPDGRAIYERSLAGSDDLRAIAEGARRRAARPAGGPGGPQRGRRDHGAHRPRRLSHRRRSGVARRPARARRATSACRRWSCAEAEDKVTPPALSRELAQADPRRAATSRSRAPATSANLEQPGRVQHARQRLHPRRGFARREDRLHRRRAGGPLFRDLDEAARSVARDRGVRAQRAGRDLRLGRGLLRPDGREPHRQRSRVSAGDHRRRVRALGRYRRPLRRRDDHLGRARLHRHRPQAPARNPAGPRARARRRAALRGRMRSRRPEVARL